MSEGRQYKRWILLDKGSLQIKEGVEHPGRGWTDLNALLERIAELEAENEWLRQQLAESETAASSHTTQETTPLATSARSAKGKIFIPRAVMKAQRGLDQRRQV